MTADSNEPTNDTHLLMLRAKQGDPKAREQLFLHYRPALKSMIKMRLNRQLQGRMDDSDVLQDVLLEAHRRLDNYLQSPQTSFLLWMRRITSDKLLEVHRNHLTTQRRNAHRDISLHSGPGLCASSYSMAAQLLGKLTPPNECALRAELQNHLQAALNELPPLDREILSLRHFEQLSNSEAAQELGLNTSAASKRYLRALGRMRCILHKYGLI